MSSSRRRKLPWHQRPRAWFRGWLYHVLGGEEEERELTDDHGNHIGQDLPPVRRWPMPPDDRPVIQAALVQGETVILNGEPSPRYNPAWMPCWSRQDVPRPGERGEGAPLVGPGIAPRSGPGYLSAFASPFGAAALTEDGLHPRTPRPPARPVVWWLPRECGGRITALAGA